MRFSRCQRAAQRPSRAQSANSDQVAEARKPASAIAWRSESSQCGSNALRRAIAHARQASTSSAASAAITIAPVDSELSPEPALALSSAACAADVDVSAVAGVLDAVVETLVAGVVGAAGVVEAPPGVTGVVTVPDGAWVVVGVVAPALAAVVAPGETPAFGLCGRADAGVGKVGVVGDAARAAGRQAAPSASSESAAAPRRASERCGSGGLRRGDRTIAPC
jgi:hypothetical protein